jgi:hypothetical protein
MHGMVLPFAKAYRTLLAALPCAIFWLFEAKRQTFHDKAANLLGKAHSAPGMSFPRISCQQYASCLQLFRPSSLAY